MVPRTQVGAAPGLWLALVGTRPLHIEGLVESVENGFKKYLLELYGSLVGIEIVELKLFEASIELGKHLVADGLLMTLVSFHFVIGIQQLLLKDVVASSGLVLGVETVPREELQLVVFEGRLHVGQEDDPEVGVFQDVLAQTRAVLLDEVYVRLERWQLVYRGVLVGLCVLGLFCGLLPVVFLLHVDDLNVVVAQG